MLHWAELGPSNETTALVPLHGMNDSRVTWKHVAPALARDRGVLMPDLPGHGLSNLPDASYELGWHARIIARFPCKIRGPGGCRRTSSRWAEAAAHLR